MRIILLTVLRRTVRKLVTLWDEGCSIFGRTGHLVGHWRSIFAQSPSWSLVAWDKRWTNFTLFVRCTLFMRQNCLVVLNMVKEISFKCLCYNIVIFFFVVFVSWNATIEMLTMCIICLVDIAFYSQVSHFYASCRWKITLGILNYYYY